MTTTPLKTTVSLRWRLLLATLIAVTIALVLAGLALHRMFRDHVIGQYRADLVVQLDQLTSIVEIGSDGQALVPAAQLSDPRWQRPLSGLYWQVAPARTSIGVEALHSRSLWDQSIDVPPDAPADGEVHAHEVAGPRGEPLLVVERVVRPEASREALRLIVAGDLAGIERSVDQFASVLARSLAALGALLALAAIAQVLVGLAPLSALGHSLQRLRSGGEHRLQGRFPLEIQPLVDDFNGVLDSQAEQLRRARAEAGNLAHALKTPLAVLQQQASQTPPSNDGAAWAQLVSQQVQSARRHVDRHLSRARAAAAHALPGLRTPIEPVAAGLIRVLGRIDQTGRVEFELLIKPAGIAFAGEQQDLQEMLGNLLDNAGKWATRKVRLSTAASVAASSGAPVVDLTIEDDGPGIAPDLRSAALQRGTRLDESVSGTGLGLAIVDELARAYGGELELGDSPLGGLKVLLRLPRATGSNPG